MSKPVWLATDAIALTCVMWCVCIFDSLLPIHFTNWGIAPRSFYGLLGIFTAPLIHGGFHHMLANTLPLIVLGSLVQVYGRNTFWTVTFIVMVISGICVWLFSNAGRVVGASGLVFGYWAFLMVYACLIRSATAIIVALVVFLLYGTLVFGLFDLRSHISWSAHFFGLLGGAIAAFMLAPKRRVRA